MKILHTSDWHLGQRLRNFDRSQEHSFFIGQLCDIMTKERPDALVVSGDVFNSIAPSAQTQTEFVDYVLSLRKASPGTSIVITAGNHDSGSRLEVDKKLWLSHNVRVIGYCERNADGTFDPSKYVIDIPGVDGKVCGYVIAVPFINTLNYPLARPDLPPERRQSEFFKALEAEAALRNREGLPVVMMAHSAVRGCILRGHEEKPIGSLEQQELSEFGGGYDYMALGHIHKPQDIPCKSGCVRYCGSPIPLSFTEDYDHSVTIVEIERHAQKPSLRVIPLEVLRKVRTIPEKAAGLEAALGCLGQLDDKDNSYIRLNVKVEGNILPPDAEDRANLIARDKDCRYCEIHIELPEPGKSGSEDSEERSIEQMKVASPMDIALEAYTRNCSGTPMRDELKDLLRQAIDSVIKNYDY